jgi:hypothetical protein
MVQISGTNERFLTKEAVLSEMMRIMDPELVFLGVIPYVDSGGENPTYGVKANKSSDAKKQTPRLKTPSSKFPEVEITRITKRSAVLSEEGLSIRLDKDAIQKKAGIDMIMDAFQTVGYWIAEYMSTGIYTTMDNGSTDSGITISNAWSADAATPLDDARAFKNAMKREGYPYRMTDLYVHMDNFEEMETYLAQSDVAAYRDAALAVGNGDEMILPMAGKPVLRGMFSGITEGDIMGLDRFHPGASLFYNNDPMFSVPQIAFETIENGKPTPKKVQNFGLSTHKYFEDDTHDTVIQIWIDYAVVVKDAYGIITENGI